LLSRIKRLFSSVKAFTLQTQNESPGCSRRFVLLKVCAETYLEGNQAGQEPWGTVPCDNMKNGTKYIEKGQLSAKILRSCASGDDLHLESQE